MKTDRPYFVHKHVKICSTGIFSCKKIYTVDIFWWNIDNEYDKSGIRLGNLEYYDVVHVPKVWGDLFSVITTYSTGDVHR